MESVFFFILFTVLKKFTSYPASVTQPGPLSYELLKSLTERLSLESFEG